MKRTGKGFYGLLIIGVLSLAVLGGCGPPEPPGPPPDTTTPINTTASNFISSGASSISSTAVTMAISATDNVGVTGYYASETSTTPSATATGWTAVTSTTSYSSTSISFTLSSGDGTKTVYVFFKDAAGNVSGSVSDTITLSTFGSTTTIVGTVYPTVVAKSTDGSSCAVDTGAAIAVTFNEDMDAATITASTFTVSGASGAVTYDAAAKKATFTPSSALAYSAAYTATITTGVKDTAGNAMANSFSWIFTTKQGANPSYLMGGAIQGNSLSPYTNVVTTFAGTAGYTGSTDGTGTAARFNYPYGITTDGTNLYVADTSNNTIRKIVIATGAVTTLAGTAGSSGSTDGTGAAARFNLPAGITTDGTNLYVADTSNNTIRKIVIASGAVTTLAGTAGSSGSTDGTGSVARFSSPYGITTDGTNLYVADSNNNTIRKIVIASGAVTTLAGSAVTTFTLGGIVGSSGSTDGTGAAARFYSPRGITTDGTNLYVADSNNNTIRKIVISTGAVTTLAGSAGLSGSTDGTGSAARFFSPYGITTDGTNLYVADGRGSLNYVVRKIVISTGAVTTVAGSGASIFYVPTGITTDGTNLYVADTQNYTIRKISASTTVPSSAPTNVTATDGNGQTTITWDSVSGATCYDLYCAVGTSVTTTTGTKIPFIASPYQLGGYWTATPIVLTNGTTYSCVATAVNSYGESGPSSSVTFTPAALHTLTVSKSGTGSGTVTSSPSGIDCGSTCSSSFTNGSSVTLTATPASGYTFTGWSGACSGTGSCVVTMSSDKSVTATFTTSTSSTYYWANWDCGTSSQCAFLMGAYTGSTGQFCTLNDCNSWKSIYFFGASCSTTATYTQHTVTYSNGVCAQSGVDF